MKRILVIGSLNMEFIIEVDKMPELKETVHGGSISLNPGGRVHKVQYPI